MVVCALSYCKSRYDKKINKINRDFCFFSFPHANRPELAKWIKFVQIERRDDFWLPTNASKLCSKHFRSEDIHYGNTGRGMLKKGSIPHYIESDDKVRKKWFTGKQWKLRQLAICHLPSLNLPTSPLSTEKMKDFPLHLSSNSTSAFVKTEIQPHETLKDEGNPKLIENLVVRDDIVNPNSDYLQHDFHDTDQYDVAKTETSMYDDIDDDYDVQMIEKPVSQLPTELEDKTDLHEGILCNVCEKEIYGFRYVCVECGDWDLCGQCEARAAHPQHYVLRVPHSRDDEEIRRVIEAVRAAVRAAGREPPTLSMEVVEEGGGEALAPELDEDNKDDIELIPELSDLRTPPPLHTDHTCNPLADCDETTSERTELVVLPESTVSANTSQFTDDVCHDVGLERYITLLDDPLTLNKNRDTHSRDIADRTPQKLGVSQYCKQETIPETHRLPPTTQRQETVTPIERKKSSQSKRLKWKMDLSTFLRHQKKNKIGWHGSAPAKPIKTYSRRNKPK